MIGDRHMIGGPFKEFLFIKETFGLLLGLGLFFGFIFYTGHGSTEKIGIGVLG